MNSYLLLFDIQSIPADSTILSTTKLELLVEDREWTEADICGWPRECPWCDWLQEHPEERRR